MMTKRDEANALALAWAQGVMADLEAMQETDNEPGLNRNLSLANLLLQISTVLDGMSYNVEPVKKLAAEFVSRAIVT